MEEFWRKSKLMIVASDLARNGTEVQHLGGLENEGLLEKLGAYLITFKNILGSKHSVGDLNTRVLNQIAACEYLMQLLSKWA